jgi:uncharacterized protein
MRWRESRRSTNVEYGGGSTLPGGFSRGGVGRTAGIGGGLGMVVLVLLALVFGIDPTAILLQGEPSETTENPAPSSPQEAQMRDFISAVLGETEDTWTELFRANGMTYQEPHLVLFTDAVQSACGFAQSAMGPFYCP